jgi:CRP-like cAMP-binding protein
MEMIRSTIESISYFNGISLDETHYVAEHSLVRTYAAGEIIFMEDEPARGLWVVETGHVKIIS